MEPPSIDVACVISLAAAQGLALPPGQAEGVAANFARIAQVAAAVLAIELDPEDEQAPVWRP